MGNEAYFLKPKDAREAFMDCVLPAIESTMKSGRTKRSHLHVVTLNPVRQYSPKSTLPILFEHSIGKKEEWEYPYDEYARRKAALTWRTGLSSRDVVMTKPHLLRPNDTPYWGSANVGGIITGCSGVQPYYDEMFAHMTSAAMVGEASNRVAMMTHAGTIPDILPKK